MNAEVWAIIATGIVILVAIATSNRSLRREMSERIAAQQRDLGDRIDAVEKRLSERIDGLSERIEGLGERITAVQQELSERITAVQQELSERISDVRERLGRVEGLLEGFGMAHRKRAGTHGDESRAPTPPPS